MPELTVDGVLSDMDGVLVDTGGIYDRHWAAWAERHDIDPALIVGQHHGRPAVLTIERVAPHLDAVVEARRYNEGLAADGDADGVVALPGALAMAQALPPDRWAVCTSATRVMAERWLAHIGIARPAVLVSVDDVARGKPAPDGYLRAAELLGCDPSRCLVIEDAPTGIAAARAAGTQVMAVQTTFVADLLGEADHVVRGLDGLRFEAAGSSLLVSWDAIDRATQ
jgi:sugar-phosphatase